MDGNGVLLSLDRESAKQLFGHREDEPLREFVINLRAELKDGENCLDLGSTFTEIEAGCEQLAARRTEWAPLGAGVCGARQLYQGADWRISLVRPDIVRMLGDVLGSIQWEALECETEGEALPGAFRTAFDSLATFYREAGARGDAVLFSAPQTEV